MKNIKIKLTALLLLVAASACEDLTSLNENKNGLEPDAVNPNLVLPTVITSTFQEMVELGYGNIAGVVQHTQLDAWFTSHNDYDWSDQSWSDYYGILRNNELVYNKAVEDDLVFHQGVCLIMKSVVFGLITDLWGDAPYSQALQGDEGNIFPEFDDQQKIYEGIIADLETANTLLSKNQSEYPEITEDVESIDMIYKGQPAGWRKMANSLLLRYYMRISSKMPDVAQEGIMKIISDPVTYPIITSVSEDAAMAYIGNNNDDSWPTAVFATADITDYKRIRMCATLVDKLQELNDPRIDVWAQKIEIPLVVDTDLPAGTDQLVDLDDDGDDDIRQLSPDVVEDVNIDTDPEYVGIPPSLTEPSSYNLGPNPGQTSVNPHVSYLNEMYSQPSGDLLKARLISAAEVHFILAEAALKGWGAADDVKAHYEAGIKASFDSWGVADDYSDYIVDVAAFDPSETTEEKLARIMTQKWIASWTAATEAWFDYRRTGLPDFQAGPAAQKAVLPVRFFYMASELDINGENAARALDRLQTTNYSGPQGQNSAWSRPWIIQGTGEPW